MVIAVAAAEAQEPGWIERYQTGLGALFGLLGLGFVAMLNAELERQRDTRLRNHEIRGLCHALAAELTTSATNCVSAASHITTKARENQLLTESDFLIMKRPVCAIYEANLNKIGLLGDISRDVVKIYEVLSRAKFYTDEVQERLKTVRTTNSVGIDVDGIWNNPAKLAIALAKRLDAYEPPDG